MQAEAVISVRRAVEMGWRFVRLRDLEWYFNVGAGVRSE